MCWVIATGAFVSGLDAAVVNLALENMSRDMSAPLALTQWTVSGYLLALAVALPAAGWLARRYGSGRVWMVSLAAFTVASGLCAAAPTMPLLITARVMQGLAGGVLIPAGQTVLGEAVGSERLGRVMGALGLAVSTAPAVGPVVGGVLLHHASWPWLFLMNLPIGLVAFALAVKLVPGTTTGTNRSPMHWTGLASISLALPLMVLAASRWSETTQFTLPIAALGAAGVIALLGFITVSLRARYPILDLRLYANVAFRASAVAALATGSLIFGSGIVFALYFQIARGQDALQTGISLAGVATATAITSPLAGRLVDREGPGLVSLIGGVLATVTLAPLTVLDASAPMWLVQGLLALFGCAIALSAMPVTVAAYQAVATEHLADAITQINIIQRFGGAISGAVCAVLIASGDSMHGIHGAILVLVVTGVSTIGGALLIRRAA